MIIIAAAEGAALRTHPTAARRLVPDGRTLFLACAIALAACGREQAPPVAAEPRVVAARGDLAADEAATIELFERSKDAVVFIAITQRVLDPWSRNVFSIPRGTGSGF